MNGRTLRWLMSLAPRPARNGRERGQLVVVRHHRVYPDGERPLYRLGVSERVFRDQLEMLAAGGLTPISVIEGWRLLTAGQPGRWVAMTFDDGYEDNVRRALPHLSAMSARATFYLTAGLMEERRAPWWDAVAQALEQTRAARLEWQVDGQRFDLPLGARSEREHALLALMPTLSCAPEERDRRIVVLRERLGVAADAACELMDWTTAAELTRAGMEVGAHTLRHPLLSRIPAASQRDEIAGSMELIERRLGVRTVGLAYPGGDYDGTTLEVVRECGLEYAVTTRAGSVGAGTPAHELPRRGLSEGACLGPTGHFSRRLAMAELDGAFDRLRGVEAVA